MSFRKNISFSVKYKSASIEDISINVAERQTKIKERLKKFFIRRPTVEQLVKKGIWKGVYEQCLFLGGSFITACLFIDTFKDLN